MKVAVTATERGLEGDVAWHFGNATHFIVAELESGKIKSAKLVESPHAGQHVPGALPDFVKSLGVEMLICGGAGPMAIKYFNEYGIKVATGAEGNVRDALEKCAQGGLGSGENRCPR